MNAGCRLRYFGDGYRRLGVDAVSTISVDDAIIPSFPIYGPVSGWEGAPQEWSVARDCFQADGWCDLIRHPLSRMCWMPITFHPIRSNQLPALSPDLREWLRPVHSDHHVSDLIDSPELSTVQIRPSLAQRRVVLVHAPCGERAMRRHGVCRRHSRLRRVVDEAMAVRDRLALGVRVAGERMARIRHEQLCASGAPASATPSTSNRATQCMGSARGDRWTNRGTRIGEIRPGPHAGSGVPAR